MLGFLILTEALFWLASYFALDIFGYYTKGNSSEKLDFISPAFGYLFLLIPIVYLLFTVILKRRNLFIKKSTTPALSGTYLSEVSNFNAFLRFLLLKSTITFLIIAAMQPAFGSKIVNTELKGVELVFAVDISVSMNTKDIDNNLSRLDVAKRSINQFINLSQSGKVGMVIFAGSAYPQLPLTSDYGAAKMYTSELNTNFISNQGTNIGLALDLSADFFTAQKTKKAIVLISDGEDHEQGIESALEKLNEKGISLFVLGLGSEKGGLIPRNTLNSAAGYMKDENGKTIVSKVNSEMLENLAKRANGKAVISGSDFPNISPLLAQINNFTPTKSIETEFEVKENRYRLFLFSGLLFLIVLIGLEEVSQLKFRRK
ncbi:MAG: VWA domain-containing protein [Lishizhenia sp.]